MNLKNEYNNYNNNIMKNWLRTIQIIETFENKNKIKRIN